MAAIALDNSDWLTSMIESLSIDLKRTLFEKLKVSLGRKSEAKAADMSFFDGISGAWNDGVSVEDAVNDIRASRQFDVTRKIADL